MQLKNLPADIVLSYGMEPFLKNDHLTSLCNYIKKGFQLKPGLELVLERSLRRHIKGKLISWTIDKDSTDDVTFMYRYYHNSMAKVETEDGKIVSFPFSMIMVDKTLLEK